MKELYSFYINRLQEVEKEEQTPEGLLKKKITEEVPVKIIIKKPLRSEIEEGDLIYAIELSKFTKMGIMTKAMVEKLYGNEGGVFTQEEKQKYLQLRLSLFEKQREFQELSLKNDRTKDDEEKLKNTLLEINEIMDGLRDLEAISQSIFDQTAENKAQAATVFWWVTFLSYIEDGENEPKPLFPGNSFSEKKEAYDDIIDKEDVFYNRVIEKLTFFISLWYLGRASTKEEFETFDPDKQEKSDAVNE